MNTNFVPINIDLIPTVEELHVVPSTGTGGRGIASDPLMIPKGDLDFPEFWGRLLTPSMKVIFGEGRFFTNGFALSLNTCVIIGQGVGRTTIQFKDNVDSVLKNKNWPHIRMISDFAQWCLNFGMRDMTLDCNWRGQQEAATNGNFKIEAVVVNSVRGKLERVDVVDAGCHASKEIYGNLGLEAFPIAFQTVSMGPPFDKYLPEHKHRGEEVASFLEISQCRVLSANFLGGGYCTAEFVVTNQPGKGDRLPKGARTTLAAWVHDCYVADIQGIAFGCAQSEHVLFERNHSIRNKCGFNCDTGRNENIVLRGNRFESNSHGANFSPDGGGKGLLVEGNTFISGPKSTNPITGLPEGYVGLSIGNTLEAVTKSNTFIGPSDWTATRFTDYPVISIDDERLVIGGTNTPVAELAAMLQANIDLSAQRNLLISERDQLLVEKTAAESAQNELRNRLAATQKQAEYAGTKLIEAALELNAAQEKLKTVQKHVQDFVLAGEVLKAYVEIEDP